MKAKILKILGCLMPIIGFSSVPTDNEGVSHHEQLRAIDVKLPEKIASSQWSTEMTVAFQAAREAGEVLLKTQNSGENLQIEQKEDYKGNLSPVTIADQRANKIICSMLHEQFPDYGILTEESVSDDAELQEAADQWKTSKMAWLIDPLDGTKDFINKGKDYGIHIGLTQDGQPVLGLNYYPETDAFYFAVLACGAYKQTGFASAQPLHVPISEGKILPLRNSTPQETAPFYQQLLGSEIVPEKFPAIESSGARICAIAEGKHTLYISLGIRGGLWDYCSSEVILHEAGGYVTDLNGKPIDYRSEEARLKFGTIVSNDKEIHHRVIEIQRELTRSGK